MCGATRLLVPAFLVGVAVASFTGHDLYGWIAAALTAGVLAVVARVRGRTTTCAVALPPGARLTDADHADEHEPLRPSS